MFEVRITYAKFFDAESMTIWPITSYLKKIVAKSEHDPSVAYINLL